MLALLISTALASDVLLPEFTAGTFSDFEVAEQMTRSIGSALRARGLAVDGPDVLLARAPDWAVSCAEEVGCPQALLEAVPARLVVVGYVASTPAGYEVAVRFYTPGDTAPAEELLRDLSQVQLTPFATEVARTAQDLLPLVAPAAPPISRADPPLFDDEADPVREPSEVPDAAPVRRTERVEDRERIEDFEPKREGPLDARIRPLPSSARESFEDSGLTADEWLARSRVRSGQLLIELHGGAAFGDIDHRYDTRVAVSTSDTGQLQQSTPYQFESFVQGKGGMAGIAVGFVPLWWLEFGLYGGVIFGAKELSTGWEQVEEGQLIDDDQVAYDPVFSTMAVLEPRTRLYLVATGPVKPYALLGLHSRFFDGYTVPDIAGKVDYPDRPGGVGMGLTAGAGLALDGMGPVMGFLEVPWTKMVMPDVYLQPGEGLTTTPTAASGSGQMLYLRAGLGMRFGVGAR